MFEGRIIEIRNHLAFIFGTQRELMKKAKKSGAIRKLFEIFQIWDNTNNIEVKIRAALQDNGINPASFAVRVYKLDQKISFSSRMLEGKIGKVIRDLFPNSTVNLDHPEIQFTLIFWNNSLAFGKFILENKGKEYNWKAPKNLPHFRGGALKPIIARQMCNILNPKEGEIVVDPFCGHGGMLLELVDIGCKPIGIELDGRVVRQAQENLKFIGYQDPIHLLMGDAFNLPLRKGSFRKIVTDPPYAIQTTTSGKKPGTLVYEWLEKFPYKTEIVFALPKEFLKELPKQWKTLMEGDNYVHKNLTRRIRLITNE